MAYQPSTSAISAMRPPTCKRGYYLFLDAEYLMFALTSVSKESRMYRILDGNQAHAAVLTAILYNHAGQLFAGVASYSKTEIGTKVRNSQDTIEFGVFARNEHLHQP